MYKFANANANQFWINQDDSETPPYNFAVPTDFGMSSDFGTQSEIAFPSLAMSAEEFAGLGAASSAQIALSSASHQTVSAATSDISFNNIFGVGVTPAYERCIISAEQTIESHWTAAAPITLNLEFIGENAGSTGFLAQNSWPFWVTVTYAQLKSALASHAIGTYAVDAVDALPATDPNPAGGADWYLPEAYARMLGLSSITAAIDDTITLNTSYNFSYGQDVINALTHEISEGAMGRVGGLGDQNGVWSTMDLFRFNASGVPDYTDGRDGQTTYFSYNGGHTLSALSFNNEYNSGGVKVNTGDTADFTQLDVFGTGSPGETNTLSETDLQTMYVLGWEPIGGATVLGQNFSVIANQSTAVASDVSVSNPGGDNVTEYAFWDAGGGTGHFSFSGGALVNGQWNVVSASNLANVGYVGGSSAGTQTLHVEVYDATTGTWSPYSEFTATTEISLTDTQISDIYTAVLQVPPSSSVIATLETLDQSQGDNAVITAVVQNALGIPNSDLNTAAPNFNVSSTSNPYAGLTSPDLVPTLEMFKMALGYFPESASNLNSIVNTGLTLPQLSSAFVNSQAFANVFNGGVILDPNQHLVAGSFTTNLIDSLFQSDLGHLPTASTVQGFVGYTISQAFLAFADLQTYYLTELSAMTQYLTGLAQTAIVGSVDASASTLAGHTAH